MLQVVTGCGFRWLSPGEQGRSSSAENKKRHVKESRKVLYKETAISFPVFWLNTLILVMLPGQRLACSLLFNLSHFTPPLRGPVTAEQPRNVLARLVSLGRFTRFWPGGTPTSLPECGAEEPQQLRRVCRQR